MATIRVKKKEKKSVPFILAVVCGVLALVFTATTVITSFYAGAINLIMGVDTYTVSNAEEGDAEYYKSQFETKEELIQYGEQLCEEVEAEGAVLLLNRNNILPLKADAKVSTFSTSSVDIVYGGLGSGNVDTSTAPTLRSALEKNGFTVNDVLWNFYSTGEAKNYRRGSCSISSMMAGTAIVEAPWSVYTSAVQDSFSKYGDAAIVVLSRIGGEGNDLSHLPEYNYLALSAEERQLLLEIAHLKEQGVFQSIVVLINSANMLEVDFLFDEAYDIDAALYIGDPGQTGLYAVAKILNGAVNPSGRMGDVFCKDNLTAPWMANFGDLTFTNADQSYFNKYVVYQEGIYVGYRYYETRYEDYVMGTDNTGEYDYNADVAFPFGYGKSYTEFAYSDFSVAEDSDGKGFTANVTVTNIGDRTGKHAVALYFQSPYTDYDVENRIEKSSVELAGFAKTKQLAAGESEVITISFSKEELRTYDAYGHGGYILDEGDYWFTIGKDAHDAVNNILAAKGYTPESTDNRMDAAGQDALCVAWHQDKLDTEIFDTEWTTGVAIKNQFDFADLTLLDNGANGLRYLSRSDWMGTFPELSFAVTVTDDMEKLYGKNRAYKAEDYEAVEMPALGVTSEIILIDARGKAYDDPIWDEILNQLTYPIMYKLVSDGFHHTIAIDSISKPATRDENGPNGSTSTLLGGGSGTAYPSADLRSCTWNVELAEKVGIGIGEDHLWAKTSGLYGTGANTHRTPYSGRNFEYYAADGVLAGSIGAAETTGIRSKGVYTLTKHFALNDQETNRSGLCTFANEQTIREIYLSPFERIITSEKGTGVMSAYSRVGLKWTGGSKNLISEVLRGEWQADGIVISDSGGGGHMDAIDAVMAQSDLFDANNTMELNSSFKEYINDPIVVTAVRDSCHRILYSIVNSLAMNGISPASQTISVTPWWQIALVCADVVFFLGCAGCIVWEVLRKKKLSNAEKQ